MTKRIFGLDVFRAIAILLVLFAHTLEYVFSGHYSYFSSYMMGFYGVEFFFVLSGFLIGGILMNSDYFTFKEIKNFWYRRWLRTLPLYYLVLPIYFLGNFLIENEQFSISYLSYTVFLQYTNISYIPFFGVSWSLCIEEWFYLIFPIFYIILSSFFSKGKGIWLINICVFIILSLLLRICLFSDKLTFYDGFRKLTFFRLDAIAFGVLGAYFSKYLYNRVLFKFIGYSSCVLLIAFNWYVFFGRAINLYFLNTVFFTLIGFILVGVILFFSKWEIAKPNFLVFSIEWISKISYSLYLLHWLVFKLLAFPFFPFLEGGMKLLVFFILSISISSLSYLYIEKPILKWRNNNIN